LVLKLIVLFYWTISERYKFFNSSFSINVHNSDAAKRGPSADEKELASKMLQMHSKRVYLDVKQNSRGRFIKIAVVGFVQCMKSKVFNVFL